MKKIRDRHKQRLFLKQVAAFLILTICLAACRQSKAPTQPVLDDITIDLQVSPQPPTVGQTTLVITLIDQEETPIRDAHVDVRGDMTHAGMAPVSAIAESSTGDQYRIPFHWTMAGDWVVTVNVTLSSGKTLKKTFDFTITSP